MDRKLWIVAAGLGWRTLERSGSTRIAGLSFSPSASVFPAVTCVAQASLRTGLPPEKTGVVSNGIWFEPFSKPLFWEQSAKLVKGARTWEARRAAGAKVGMFFFQQSLGESVDAIVSPAPIHKHGGGMIMACATKPGDLAGIAEKRFGRFPLWRYWGPLASPKIGRKCIDWFETAADVCDLDEAYLYLPTLDYAAQKYGPASRRSAAALKELRSQIERLSEWCAKRGWRISVTGDYDIAPVSKAPFAPNAVLREKGFFAVRNVAGMAYPDFHRSSAFAVCDHEFCVVYGEKRKEACEALLAGGRCILSPDQPAEPLGGTVLLAEEGSWCAYEWWTDGREAPDFASHVDIHNKPGFDPKELFFFCRGTVKGTHGRKCAVARADAG